MHYCNKWACSHGYFHPLILLQHTCRSLPPARKLRQGNVFTPVCHSVHRRGCLPLVWWVSVTPQADPPGRPSWADPTGQTPPGRHPPWKDTPCPVHAGIHTPHPVNAGIWSTSRRYVSDWNAFLFLGEVYFWRCHWHTMWMNL